MTELASGAVPDEASGTTIRVFLVDDHELVRRGLCDVLAGDRDIVIVGEAAAAADAVREVLRLSPDVVLLDVRLPDGSGVDVCRPVRAHDPSVRFLCSPRTTTARRSSRRPRRRSSRSSTRTA